MSQKSGTHPAMGADRRNIVVGDAAVGCVETTGLHPYSCSGPQCNESATETMLWCDPQPGVPATARRDGKSNGNQILGKAASPDPCHAQQFQSGVERTKARHALGKAIGLHRWRHIDQVVR